MDAVIIRVIDLPFGVNGLTVKDAEGDYNVYLNARLCGEKQVETFRHELDHIQSGHFYDQKPVRAKEMETQSRMR